MREYEIDYFPYRLFFEDAIGVAEQIFASLESEGSQSCLIVLNYLRT